jgi:type I restriction enzyme S subunit
MLLRADRRKVSPEYLYYFFRGEQGQHELLANTSTTGFPAISKPTTSLKAISVLLPPKPVLDAFGLAAIAIARRSSRAEQQNETLVALRDLLLPRPISGDLRIPDAKRMVRDAIK